MDWLLRYRFLILIYATATLAGLWEFFHPGPPQEPAEVMLDLYPESSEIQYKIGRYFEGQNELSRARHHFEKALATRVKTDENLFWHYAYVLVQLEADPKEIDAAIAKWRYNFPESERPDPRDPKSVELAKSEAMPMRSAPPYSR
ncbi:MAG: hypothetical protein AB7O26_04625 [Planctomycetaceae bacterium]